MRKSLLTAGDSKANASFMAPQVDLTTLFLRMVGPGCILALYRVLCCSVLGYLTCVDVHIGGVVVFQKDEERKNFQFLPKFVRSFVCLLVQHKC